VQHYRAPAVKLCHILRCKQCLLLILQLKFYDPFLLCHRISRCFVLHRPIIKRAAHEPQPLSRLKLARPAQSCIIAGIHLRGLMASMKYKDLRDFIAQLEQRGELVRVKAEVSPVLEMTEIADRTLRAGGPALLFENVTGHSMPVLANLFGTPQRVALGMGQEDVGALREVGKLLAFLKEPEPPKGLKDAFSKLPIFKQVLNMSPKQVKKAACQEIVLSGDEVDLTRLPVMTCWPGDAGPLVTWPLVITRGPEKERQNLGIYRMQLIGKNRLFFQSAGQRVPLVAAILGKRVSLD